MMMLTPGRKTSSMSAVSTGPFCIWSIFAGWMTWPTPIILPCMVKGERLGVYSEIEEPGSRKTLCGKKPELAIAVRCWPPSKW